MNKKLIDKYIDSINDSAEKPMVTPNFGDKWKEYAKDIPKSGLIDIAWREGRRAILLERALRKQLENELPERSEERLRNLLNNI